jgi:SAM-dependent methyltransferase
MFSNVRFIAADLSEIDIDLDRKFDLIICADVLEHLLNPNPCLEFIGRHIISNGVAILSTPERDNLRGKDSDHSPHPAHVREWSGQEFREYLEHQGWAIRQYHLYPQARLNPIEQIAWKILGSGFLRRRWASCQAVVCTPAADDTR